MKYLRRNKVNKIQCIFNRSSPGINIFLLYANDMSHKVDTTCCQTELNTKKTAKVLLT